MNILALLNIVIIALCLLISLIEGGNTETRGSLVLAFAIGFTVSTLTAIPLWGR
jgi:hypothetical protein